MCFFLEIFLHDFTDSQGSKQLVESLPPHLRRKYVLDFPWNLEIFVRILSDWNDFPLDLERSCLFRL